jgi:tRNA (mo5U34)-methyltransferase
VAPTPTSALELIERSEFVWHQRFELVPGVWTPGTSPVGRLWELAQLPGDLSGLTVLDVGTTNAGTAFEAERRGAKRVVAVDIYDADWFGVRALTEFLQSRVEYVRCSAYELASRFEEPFDVVIFWGVLYHLRHPLLALDSLRSVTAGSVSLETAVCDYDLPARQRARPLACFYRGDELAGDSSNWFAPTLLGLQEWCRSSGFEIERTTAWPSHGPTRAMISLRPTGGPAEYETLSYESPLQVKVSRLPQP